MYDIECILYACIMCMCAHTNEKIEKLHISLTTQLTSSEDVGRERGLNVVAKGQYGHTFKAYFV